MLSLGTTQGRAGTRLTLRGHISWHRALKMPPGPDSRDLPLRHTQDRGEPGVGAGTMGELQGPKHVAELPVERAAPLIGPGCAAESFSFHCGCEGAWGQG